MTRIEWCNDPKEIASLTAFFANNLTVAYISHSEIQFGRAAAPDKWSSNLGKMLESEIAERLNMAPGAPTRVAAAYDGNHLVGIAYVTFNLSVPVPFIVLEDIVVERSNRDRGIGQAMIDWIFEGAKNEGARRVFLESGKENHDAHHFFERNGFHQVSIVMMANLPI